MDPYLDPRPQGAPVALVVGTMNFGKRTPEPESHRIVARALERGLDFFDTANAYVGGESERILGRALRGKRARIATKVGFGPKVSEPEGLAPERIAAAIDESLS
ncbi:MAG: aldo/keto reductase, partial [Myxococcales bacterium]|nr:aldo/keto reductase [Myxococcales bacterium]